MLYYLCIKNCSGNFENIENLFLRYNCRYQSITVYEKRALKLKEILKKHGSKIGIFRKFEKARYGSCLLELNRSDSNLLINLKILHHFLDSLELLRHLNLLLRCNGINIQKGYGHNHI